MTPTDRGDDLAITAIVGGSVLGMLATSVWLGVPLTHEGREPMVVIEAVELSQDAEDVVVSEPFTDPRGPERGPTALEWEVIRTYKPIESMTATEPSRDVVDETLARLRGYANEHPENPYIQELYLKGLRVARYYAVDVNDMVRAATLDAVFASHAVRFMEYGLVAREAEWMDAQRKEQAGQRTR